MNKNLTGGSIIPYGPALPATSTASDGELFYLTTGTGQGLYQFGFNQDSNSLAFGDQVSQTWNLIQSPGVYVAKAGDTMLGQLEVPSFLRITNTSGNQRLVIGNQDSGGVNKPVIFDGYNGVATIGTGSTWTGNGGSLTTGLSIDPSSTTGLRWLGNTVWAANNDGSGSGLDADLLDGRDGTYYLTLANQTGQLTTGQLPFMPVQQGGGTSQLTNKIYVGWSGTSQLRVQVDSTDFGTTWPININGSAVSANTANSATNATESVNALWIRSGQTTGGTQLGFNNSTNSGQPGVVWGLANSGSTVATMYNPLNFTVAAATTANSANSATLAAKASTLAQAGGNGTAMTFSYAGNSGTPAWVWGNNGDGVTMQVWNPANFAVASAASVPWTGVTGKPTIIYGTVDTWQTSTDGANRLRFNSGGSTVFGTDSTFEWHNVSDATALSLDSAGNLTATGNVTAYSDRNLKENVVLITNALDKVDALNGVTYTRKDDGRAGTGLIAQDVQAVLPEAVQENENGMLSLAYGNLAGLMVEAIKELRAEVESLKAQLAEKN